MVDCLPALRISNQHSPITNLEYRFAFTDIANAKGYSRLVIGEC
jgi:hypothetical protein